MVLGRFNTEKPKQEKETEKKKGCVAKSYTKVKGHTVYLIGDYDKEDNVKLYSDAFKKIFCLSIIFLDKNATFFLSLCPRCEGIFGPACSFLVNSEGCINNFILKMCNKFYEPM